MKPDIFRETLRDILRPRRYPATPTAVHAAHRFRTARRFRLEAASDDFATAANIARELSFISFSQ